MVVHITCEYVFLSVVTLASALSLLRARTKTEAITGKNGGKEMGM